jgi:Class II Aldolase and Adducin N-terminal domain
LEVNPNVTALDVKQQLVDAIRMLARANIVDHSGHGSVRRDDRSFYINSAASTRAALTSDDIVIADLDGNLVEGSARPPFEYPIHSEIYRVRPDVRAIMHTHPQWSTVLTMVGAPYKVVYAQGALLGDVRVVDTPLSVNSRPMGEMVAATLAPPRFCSNHMAPSSLDRISSSASRWLHTSRRTRSGNIWRCRSASHMSSAKRSRTRAARGSGRGVCSGRPGITTIRRCDSGSVLDRHRHVAQTVG